MSKNWPYAILSKAASEVGGPEELLKLIRSDSFNRGQRSMLPWVALCSAIASAFTLGIIKLAERSLQDEEKVSQEVVKAEDKIINGVKEYNVTNHELEKQDVWT